jgi:DNA-binding CsgD family transcriptional regulator/tetratricopeptide (TPR) repeat protein
VISASSGARFVGRSRELAQAVGALARPDSILVVEGEPGIGKTRLLREALRAPAIAPLERLHMACPPLEEPFPFGPVVDALRRRSIEGLELTLLAGALRPLFPEWSAHLPEAPPPLDDPRATRHRLFRAVAEVVERLGIELLVLDDAHWADSSTLDLLLSLVADRQSRLRLAIGYRAVDVPAESALVRLVSGAGSGLVPVRASLSTLDEAETRDLVASVFGVSEVSEEFVRWLHERTDGVPLAVEETLWLLRDRGDVVWRDGEWERCAVEDLDVPPSVRDSVLERVMRLPATARAVLRAASVLSDPATESELHCVSGLEEQAARQGLATALAADLLHEDAPGSYAFRHQLAARAVEEATPVSERRRLHAAAAAALRIRTPPPLGRLGRHYREADDQAAWSANAETAAELAVESGDDHTAVTRLVELLTAVDHAPAERLRIARRLGDVAARGVASLGDTGARVTAVLREVTSQVEEPRSAVAEVRLSLGRLLLQLGEFDAAADEIEEATGGLEGIPVGAAKAAISLAWPRGHRWPAERHRTWMTRASALTDAVPPGLERTWLEVDRASVLLMLGDEEGWAVAEELRPHTDSIEEQRHIARLLLNMGHVGIAWGRDEQARRCLEEAVATMAATGYRRLLNSARLTLAFLDWHRGAWSGLAERTRALADADATLPEARLEAVQTLALLGLAGGRRAASERELLRVHKELVRRGVTDSQPGPAAALGRLYLAEGDVRRALDVTGPVIDTIGRKQMWLWASGLTFAHVEALLTEGDHAAAVAVVGEYERGTKVDCAPAPHAALHALHGLLEAANDDHDASAASFRAASDAWSDIGRPLPALLAGERRAGAELAAGDHEAAVRQLRSVERGLRTLGARWDADRVARALREHGIEVDRVWRGGRRGYGRELSPRELEVARLVAEGLTNRQVAEALFLSPRTVERHLGAAMRKLGISGRATLARLAAESGLPDPSQEG